MATYCTYFDEGYASRGELMINSLLAVEPQAKIWVLAMSENAGRHVRDRLGPQVTTVSLAEFEKTRPDIARTRSERSRMEYMFTCTAGWTRYVMDHGARQGEWVTYLDADLYFFRSPSVIYGDLEEGSVGLVPHHFAWLRPDLKRYGRFNVGWVSFRMDQDGQRCARWWDDRCVEWCFDRVEPGRFADQKYLDVLPGMTDRLVVLNRRGVNAAPWNIIGQKIEADALGPLLDGEPLIFFHYHGIKQRKDRFYLRNWYYGARPSSSVRNILYRPYLTQLSQVDREIGRSSMSARSRTRSEVRADLGLVASRVSGDSLTL